MHTWSIVSFGKASSAMPSLWNAGEPHQQMAKIPAGGSYERMTKYMGLQDSSNIVLPLLCSG